MYYSEFLFIPVCAIGVTSCFICHRQYGLDPAALPGAAPAHRESLRAFVKRKLCPRQPPGFADLVASMLARDPKDRPTAEEAARWPGAWEELR